MTTGQNVQRLDKIISNSGLGSRADVKKLVKKGLIKVDGQILKDYGIKVCPDTQEIIVDGQILNYKKYLYIMMNKPQGVISATYDPRQRTCIDLLSPELKQRDLFPAGRLDIDTEGMLILTNDGQLAHNILSPKKHVYKKYFAKVTGNVNQNDVVAFENGIVLDDEYKTLPATLRIIETRQSEEYGMTVSYVEIMIKEGKFHQIKRMFEAIDKKVIYLKRMEMASLALDESLKLGEYRELTENEREKLLKVAGMLPSQ